MKYFLNLSLAIGLTLQLLNSPIGNQNFRKTTKQNITTERTPQSVKATLFLVQKGANWPCFHARFRDPRLRFAVQFDVRDFIRLCPRVADIPTMAFCQPSNNLGVQYIYFGCGRAADVPAISNDVNGECH